MILAALNSELAASSLCKEWNERVPIHPPRIRRLCDLKEIQKIISKMFTTYLLSKLSQWPRVSLHSYVLESFGPIFCKIRVNTCVPCGGVTRENKLYLFNIYAVIWMNPKNFYPVLLVIDLWIWFPCWESPFWKKLPTFFHSVSCVMVFCILLWRLCWSVFQLICISAYLSQFCQGYLRAHFAWIKPQIRMWSITFTFLMLFFSNTIITPASICKWHLLLLMKFLIN